MAASICKRLGIRAHVRAQEVSANGRQWGGAGKGRKKPIPSPTTIASSSSSSLEHFLLFPAVYHFHHPLRRRHDSFSGDRIRLGPHQNTPALKANCFLPLTQESGAFSLQLVSF